MQIYANIRERQPAFGWRFWFALSSTACFPVAAAANSMDGLVYFVFLIFFFLGILLFMFGMTIYSMVVAILAMRRQSKTPTEDLKYAKKIGKIATFAFVMMALSEVSGVFLLATLGRDKEIGAIGGLFCLTGVLLGLCAFYLRRKRSVIMSSLNQTFDASSNKKM